MDARLISDIKISEGCSLKAYKDSLGLWTIGYGHLLPDQTFNYSKTTISQTQADAYLASDLEQAQNRCLNLPEWKSLDTPCRQNAVIELEFNMAGKWRSFAKTRLDIQDKAWQSAHDALLNSLWAKQVGPIRSQRLANYLLTGQYPEN